MTAFQGTIESYQQGARTMPGRYYTAPDVLALEQERIFRRRWLCVGRQADYPAPGDYRLHQIAGEPLIVLRDRTGQLRAYYNVCRHRGTRICAVGQGRLSETLQCQYHAWTWSLDGRLVGAPHMQEVAGFDKRDFPLHPVSLGEWEGFVFVSLSPDPEPFASAFSPMLGRLSRYELPSLVEVRRIDYVAKANWKLILQNYNECLHCPTIHPELSRKLPYTSGANDLAEGPFLGGYMLITPGNASATLSGRACGLPLGALPADDLRRAYYYSLFPTMMLSLHPDYAVYYLVRPLGPAESAITSVWLVHPDSPGWADYNIADAADFWDLTNRQDWRICEEGQIGISSRQYEPGPYSPRESIPAAWDREYLRAMGVEDEV